MQRLASRLPLSIAVLADLAVAEGRPEEAIELISQAYELADATEEQHGTARRFPRHASTKLHRRVEMEPA
jgi:DNA-binding transcriptional regulator YbjK